jgi:hypothetical protein
VAEEKVKLTFEADIAQFKKSVQQIPGVTEQQVDKMVQNYKSGLKKIDKSAGETTKSVKKLADGLGFGDKASKISNLAEGIGAIGPAGLAGAAGVAAIGVSLGGIYLAGKAVVDLAGWISDATAKTEQLARPLALIAGMEIISAESIAAAAEYQAQLSTLDTVSSGFAQVLVDEMSPAMSNAAAIATGASIEMLQLAKATQTTADAFTEAYPVISDMLSELASTVAIGGTGQAMIGLANDLGVATGAWAHFAEVGHGATKALADDKIALDDWKAAKARNDKADDALLAKTKAINEEIGRKQVAALKAAESEWDRHVESINKMIDSGYEQRTIAETQAVYDLADAEIARTKAINDMFDAGMAAASQEKFEADKAASDNSIALAQEGHDIIAGLEQEAFDTAMAFGTQLADQAQQHHENEIARLNESIARRTENLNQAIKDGNTERAAKIRGNIAADKAEADGQRKAAKRAYAVSKSIAIMGIAISTAQATMALLASPAIAPAGPGAPALAAGLAIGTGVLQAAAVAASPAPKFHAGRAPDEQSATLTRSEAVLNPRAVANVGGAQGVNALNAGASPGGGSSPVYLAIDGRQADLLVSTGLRSGKSTALALQTRRDALGAGHYGRR